MRTTRLQVRLDGVEPLVLRVLDVPAAVSVDELHLLFQAALGFQDTHLYEFGVGEKRFGPGDEDAPEDVLLASSARLTDLSAAFTYDYDFGDSWSAAVEVLGAGGEEPGLVSGEGHEPQDDIGGAPGYLEALAAKELRPFDADRIGTRIRRVLGRVPPGVQVVLDVLAPGVKVTPQRRLPQKTVREIQQRVPDWHLFGAEGKPAHREDDLPPLEAVHDLVLAAGLARHRHGVLAPTKAAADPAEVLRRTRSAYRPETFAGLVVGAVVSVLLVDGPQEPEALAAEFHAGFGFRYSLDGRSPLSEDDMDMALVDQRPLLLALGQVVENDSWQDRTWRAGPEAGWWLPRTGLLEPRVS
ncbi:plasmid pRiA4b ORF-3 family protein [Actinomycetospora aeridis]|uniref:Plasmid pRiA4b ORF-3 family protein n=1 Tax=Actinomycetospora aeridis TaxID=3129231 RepID=A0ABU8N8Z2_9PSEU